MTPGTAPEIRLQAPPHLIGRRTALQALTTAFDRALAGEASVVLVSGEPGVGKTRLVRELTAQAERRGAQVCMSRCIEGSVVPYLPFATALLPRLERAGLAEPGHVLHLLRPGGVPVGVDPIENRTPELFFALPRATFELASRRPLLLVVDDVHWADASTLGVLEHLVLGASDEAGQREIPLCLVVVYRDLAPSSAAARTIARIRREHIVQSIALSGLDELELNDLLWEAAGGPVAPPLLTALHRATGGNPLLALESLKLLAAQHSLHRVRDYIVSEADPDDLTIHNELTAAIEERVAAVPPETADILTVAALHGDEVPLSLLAAVTGSPVDQVVELVEPALAEGFVLESGEGLRFAHPLVRRVFGRRWSSGRRRRTHLRIAEALSTDGGPPDELEIASHLLAAGSAAEPAMRGSAAAAAGQRAFALSAWGEAARFYSAALEAAPYVNNLSAAEGAALTLRTAQAQYRNLDIAASQSTFLRAATLHRDAGEALGWADSLVGWIRAQISHDLTAGARLVDAPEIRQFLDERDQHDPKATARLEAQIAEMYFEMQRPAEARDYAARALAVGQESEDASLTLHAADTLAIASWQALDPEGALQHHETALVAARRVGDPWFEAWPLQRMPLSLAALGRLKEAELVARDAAELFQRTHDWAEHSLTLATSTALATLRGDFELAERSAAECALMFRRSMYVWPPGMVFPALIQGRLARGDRDGAEHAVQLWRDTGASGPAWTAMLLCLAHRGDYARLHAELTDHPGRVQRRFAADMLSLGALCMRVEVAGLSSLPELAEGARGVLAEAVEKGVLYALPLGSYLIPRVLGDLALLEDDFEEAEARYASAIATARMGRARAELAHASFGMAQLLVMRSAAGDRMRGRTHLGEALALFDELGMNAWLERARDLASVHNVTAPATRRAPVQSEDDTDLLEHLSHGLGKREIAERLLLGERAVGQRVAALKARTGVSTPAEAQAYIARLAPAEPIATPSRRRHATVAEGGLRLVLVSDIVGSTHLNEELGDDQWVQLLQQHNRIVREQLARFDGLEVKHTGDGIFAWFPSASGALGCALAVSVQFPIFHSGDSGGRADVCIGISAGEPVMTEDDLVGLSVTQAFRICDRAGPGEVLVSDAVRRLAEGSRFDFRDRGRLALKGFRERTQVHSVLLRDKESTSVA